MAELKLVRSVPGSGARLATPDSEPVVLGTYELETVPIAMSMHVIQI